MLVTPTPNRRNFSGLPWFGVSVPNEYPKGQLTHLLRFVGIILVAVGVMAFAIPCQTHASKNWKAKERIKSYPITGTTGRALYASIGKHGPRLKGGRRTIAHTTFDLKWRRNYKPQGSACKLVSARPFLTIIYTVPKVKTNLTGPLASKWNRFYAGILTHEKVHGKYVREAVYEIMQSTVGLTVKNDLKCQKIRTKVLQEVKTAYKNYSTKSRVFDQAETTSNGNVRQLVKALVGE